MIEVESTVRKWGNSFGLVIPKDIAESENIKVDMKIKFAILEENKILKESFGICKGKWKKSAQRIKDEARKELYNE